MLSKLTLIVVDIDGCIADGTERFARAGFEPSRANKQLYDAWVALVNEGMECDKPVLGMLGLLKCLRTEDANVIYLTSREEEHRRKTEDWIFTHGFPWFSLFMRPKGNNEEGPAFKEQLIRQFESATHCAYVTVIDDDEHGGLEKICKTRGWCFLKARSGGQR